MKVLPANSTGKKISLASKMKGCRYTVSDIRDPQLLEILRSRCVSQSPDYMVKEISDGMFDITINGDKNIFKTVFSSDISKFHIAGSCRIVRRELFMEGL